MAASPAVPPIEIVDPAALLRCDETVLIGRGRGRALRIDGDTDREPLCERYPGSGHDSHGKPEHQLVLLRPRRQAAFHMTSRSGVPGSSHADSIESRLARLVVYNSDPVDTAFLRDLRWGGANAGCRGCCLPELAFAGPVRGE